MQSPVTYMQASSSGYLPHTFSPGSAIDLSWKEKFSLMVSVVIVCADVFVVCVCVCIVYM